MSIAAPTAYEAAPTAYEQHRDYVLNVLGRRCGWLNESDREAIWHDAYTVMLEKQRDDRLALAAMNAHQVRAYLTQTALNKALREGDRAHRKTSVALEDGGLEVGDGKPAADLLLAQDFEGARLREIVAELPERQQVVIKLRFFFDHTPDEIQAYLGVTERVYRRELERAMRTLTNRFEQVREGTFCESRRSLILGYVTGIAGPNRMRQARRHLDSCPGCAHWAVQLRDTARQAGAVVPLPLLTGEWLQRGHQVSGHGFGVVRDRLADLLSGAREHATALAVRADPATSSALGGLRPGAAVAAVAGCLAIGSGATYCAVSGIPEPVRDLLGASSQARKPAPKPVTAQSPPSGTAAGSTTTAGNRTRSTGSSGSGQQSRQQRQRAKAKQIEKRTSTEFGVEASGSPSTASSPSAGASAAPASGGSSSDGNWGTEFGP